jgi:hypothetical protein
MWTDLQHWTAAIYTKQGFIIILSAAVFTDHVYNPWELFSDHYAYFHFYHTTKNCLGSSLLFLIGTSDSVWVLPALKPFYLIDDSHITFSNPNTKRGHPP